MSLSSKDGSATATVTARVLAEHRGQGFGEQLHTPWIELRLAR
ncbi:MULTISPECIES: hypothetical protein [unclassified Streptomyces]|uniref:GNAT family N-acetyltransferase n=1 Tax=Streptomyces sp. NBC_00060 TaxID=2975636 RepID=A0AAU2GUI3_9ACTN